MIWLDWSTANEPLFLQWKEARQSVLEPYAGASAYPHHGQRVVMGQRLMQPATDVFLGWLTGKLGRHGYVRQLRDAKIKPLVEAMDFGLLKRYAKGPACASRWRRRRKQWRAGRCRCSYRQPVDRRCASGPRGGSAYDPCLPVPLPRRGRPSGGGHLSQCRRQGIARTLRDGAE